MRQGFTAPAVFHREPDFEPPQGHLHAPHFAGVGEGYTEFQRQWHRSGQIVQQLRFPTVHPLVVDLAPAIMARSEDELAVGQVHLLEDLLIIQSCIAYEAQFKCRNKARLIRMAR